MTKNYSLVKPRIGIVLSHATLHQRDSVSVLRSHKEEGEQRSLLDRGSIASIQIPLAAYLQQAKFLAPKTQSSYPEEGRYV